MTEPSIVLETLASNTSAVSLSSTLSPSVSHVPVSNSTFRRDTSNRPKNLVPCPQINICNRERESTTQARSGSCHNCKSAGPRMYPPDIACRTPWRVSQISGALTDDSHAPVMAFLCLHRLSFPGKEHETMRCSSESTFSCKCRTSAVSGLDDQTKTACRNDQSPFWAQS